MLKAFNLRRNNGQLGTALQIMMILMVYVVIPITSVAVHIALIIIALSVMWLEIEYISIPDTYPVWVAHQPLRIHVFASPETAMSYYEDVYEVPVNMINEHNDGVKLIVQTPDAFSILLTREFLHI